MSDKKVRLEQLREVWQGCKLCDLHKVRGKKPTVFGAGNPDADILIITEAPSKDDMMVCAPHSSDMGWVLSDHLMEAKIDPDSVYRMTLVGCRPFVIIPATDDEKEHEQDFPPQTASVESCRPRVDKIIYTVDPMLIITMGAVAWKALVPPRSRDGKKSIADAAGLYFNGEVAGKTRTVIYPVLALESLHTIAENPSSAEHGITFTTIRHLNAAQHYVQWLKQETK